MLKTQGGGCAICRKPPKKLRLHIDHDHVSGKVRGLLCARCNSAIEWSLVHSAAAHLYVQGRLNG